MTALVVVTIACALVIGVSLGLLGAGGSILTVPLLTFVTAMSPREAITSSLFAVAVTAALAAVLHGRHGRVRWRMGLVFGVAGIGGALGGARLSTWLPERLLMVLFALLMASAAVAMLRGRRWIEERDETPLTARSVALIALQGVLLGAVTGLVGVGGGFIIVPVLTLIARLPLKQAVGTSVMIIAINASAGFAGHVGRASIDWTVTLAVTAAMMCGSVVGGRLCSRVEPENLRQGFGWFVIAVAVFVLVSQI
ncbi:MAG: sulfite exporter TauE/SafE family protein [Deltaproteobacteria bacterium]|nr:sulfite exporter TauE/SafE family protein [Kofleriaceae bacterium]